MMIDVNGPDIEGVDEVKTLILEFVHVCKNNKKRTPSRDSQVTVKGTVCPKAPTRRGMFTLNSRDLMMWFSMISSTMISFQKVMVKSQNECDVYSPGE